MGSTHRHRYIPDPQVCKRKELRLENVLVNLSNIKLGVTFNTFGTVSTAFWSTLATNKGLGIYKELTGTSNIKDTITPPIGHTQYATGRSTYKHLARIIRDHITKKETIDNEKSPNVFKIMLRQQMNEDVFIILRKIVQDGNHHQDG